MYEGYLTRLHTNNAMFLVAPPHVLARLMLVPTGTRAGEFFNATPPQIFHHQMFFVCEIFFSSGRSASDAIGRNSLEDGLRISVKRGATKRVACCKKTIQQNFFRGSGVR